jgi:hypothetical protein
MRVVLGVISIVVLVLFAGPGNGAETGASIGTPDAVVAVARASGLDESDLYSAADRCDGRGVVAALEAGAGIDSPGPRGRPAVVIATERGCFVLAGILLQRGADADAVGPDGRAAIHIAAEKRYNGIIALLMSAGADLSIRGLFDKTPVEVARQAYGTLKPENKAVRALLAGKTLPEVQEREDAAWRQEWELGKRFRLCKECAESQVLRDASGPDGARWAVTPKILNRQYRVCVNAKACDPLPKQSLAISLRSLGIPGASPDKAPDGMRPEDIAHTSWKGERQYCKWMDEQSGGKHQCLVVKDREYKERVFPSDRYLSSRMLGKSNPLINLNWWRYQDWDSWQPKQDWNWKSDESKKIKPLIGIGILPNLFPVRADLATLFQRLADENRGFRVGVDLTR